MTDEAILLAAIIARPDDDQMRLGYADWLEETATWEKCPPCYGRGKAIHMGTGGSIPAPPCGLCHGTGEVSNGHAERASFIRVQVELAQKMGEAAPAFWEALDSRYAIDGAAADCKCKYHALRRRERELYTTSEKWMLPTLPDAIAGFVIDQQEWRMSVWGGEMVGFARRGFVEEIACSWSDWRTHADAIRRATPLRKVRTAMPDEERWKCWTFSPPHAETFLRHPDYKGIEFELPQEPQYRIEWGEETVVAPAGSWTRD